MNTEEGITIARATFMALGLITLGTLLIAALAFVVAVATS